MLAELKESNLTPFKRLYNSFIRTIIVLTLSSYGFPMFGQVGVETIPNTICTGESKKCEYTGPSILINEISISPSLHDGSLVTMSEYVLPDWGEGEWIELYNPNECDEVDISGYMLGSFNSIGAMAMANGGGEANGMGYILPEGSVVPPNGFAVVRGRNAAEPPPGVIDIVALELQNNICVDGGTKSRFWFANSGGWFAFYDTNGVVQDAVKWGVPLLSDLDKKPCIPSANVFPSSITSLSSYNEAGIGHHLGPFAFGQTYVRVPDGGDWSTNMADENSSLGSCNVPGGCLNGEGSSTCNGTATLRPSFGLAPYTYVWNDDLEQTTAVATKLCAGTYNVLVTDATGIAETITVVVKDEFLEIDSLVVIQPNCNVEYGSIEVFLKGKSAVNGSYTYDWSPAVSSINIAENLEGGHYGITISDTYCLRDTFAVIRDKEIKISMSVDQPLACLEKPVNFNNYSTGVQAGTSSCEWDFGDGASSAICSPSHLYDSTGSYDVTLKITDEFGCEKEAIVNAMVKVNSLPVIDLGRDTVFCGNQTKVLDAGLGFVDYQWSNGGEGVNTNTVYPNGEESVIVTDINGCKGSDTILLLPTPFPIFNLGEDLALCEGEISTLAVPLNDVNYFWNTGEISSEIKVSITGNYSVVVTNIHDCSASDSIEVNFVSYPSHASINKDTLGCVGDVHILSINTDAEQTVWSNGATGITNEVYETGVYKATSSNNLDDASCAVTDSIDVIFYPYANIIVPDTSVYCFEFGESLVVSTPSIASYYDWETEINHFFQTTRGKEIRVYEEGVYTVKVYDYPHCQIKQDVVVEEKCPLRFYVPNSFTPNGDGINDLFFPVAPNFESLEFTIFNRWGELIFHSIQGEGWDGRINGEVAQQGVYVWRCSASGYDNNYSKKLISKNGVVTLVR